jgi:hypothetical protein
MQGIMHKHMCEHRTNKLTHHQVMVLLHVHTHVKRRTAQQIAALLAKHNSKRCTNKPTYHQVVVLLHVRVVRPAAAAPVVQLVVSNQAAHTRRELLHVRLQTDSMVHMHGRCGTICFTTRSSHGTVSSKLAEALQQHEPSRVMQAALCRECVQSDKIALRQLQLSAYESVRYR